MSPDFTDAPFVFTDTPAGGITFADTSDLTRRLRLPTKAFDGWKAGDCYLIVEKMPGHFELKPIKVKVFEPILE